MHNSSKKIAISWQSQFRAWLSRMAFVKLLILWTLVYFSVGVVFSFLYNINGLLIWSRPMQAYDVLHFSFTTLSTVGYGDIVPSGVCRFLAAIEAFLGLSLNAVLLSVTVVKALRRPAPILFPELLSYDVENRQFWFRFINTDPVSLVDGTIEIRIDRPIAGNTEKTPLYDVEWGYLKLPYSRFSNWPSMRLIAVRSTSCIPGQEESPIGFGGINIELSPLHLHSSDRHELNPYITVSVNSRFFDSGDYTVSERRYLLSEIRCGSYQDVNNQNYEGFSARKEGNEIGRVFSHIEKTDEDYCSRSCHLFSRDCPLDVAKEIRGRLSETLPT